MYFKLDDGCISETLNVPSSWKPHTFPSRAEIGLLVGSFPLCLLFLSFVEVVRWEYGNINDRK